MSKAKTKSLAIEDIGIGKRHRKEVGNLRELANSINAEGLLQPIGVTEDNESGSLRLCFFIALSINSVYRYALEAGNVPQEYIEGVQETALKSAFRKLLSSVKIEMEDGTTIRQYQSYRRFVQTEDGQEIQQDLWKDIHEMSYGEMVSAVKQRRRNIKGAVDSLKADVGYWNSNVRNKGSKRIQLAFDFMNN